MNKSELIDIIAAEADITKVAAEKALSAVTGAIVKTVSKGGTVALIGFGTFKSSKRAARIGRNPQTGEAIKIAAKTVVKFRVAKAVKDAIAPTKK